MKANGVHIGAFRCGDAAERQSLTPVQSSCNCSGSPYTSSVDGGDDDACSFSFHVLRVLNRANGRTSAQCKSEWHSRGAFSCQPILSIMPVLSGCHNVVLARGDPVMLANVLKRLASNCLPWSVVIYLWQLKWLSQTAVKILATVSVASFPLISFYSCAFLLLQEVFTWPDDCMVL